VASAAAAAEEEEEEEDAAPVLVFSRAPKRMKMEEAPHAAPLPPSAPTPALLPPSAPPSASLSHAATACRFEARDAAQALLASLDYVLDGACMDIVHTSTEAAHRGQGLAGRLTAAACEWARQQKLAVRPTCTYVSETWLPRARLQGETLPEIVGE